MDVRDAYDLLAGGVVVPRPDRGLLRIAGPQRIWFLQNTISNDVDDLPEGRWVESCFLQLKGKVLAHFRVGAAPDEVWLDVDPPGTSDLLDWFVRYRFRTKVEIEDRSPGSVAVIGPPATALAGDGEIRVVPSGVVFGGTLGPHPVADVHSAHPPEELAGLQVAPALLYEILRVEAGVGLFGVDYGPDTLPQEAGLTPIVSVTKGCYVGQEVMARLHFRGHVNRSLRTLSFEEIEDPDAVVGADLVQDGSKIGTVTSAVLSPARGSIGIGMVRVEPEAGSVVDVKGGGVAVLGPLPEGTKVTKS